MTNRRQFIANAAATGFTALAAPHVFAQADTAETTWARINRTKGGCTRCLGTGKTKKANPKFKWTPGTLAVAVGIGMKKLDGLPITRADADFSHALAEDDARAAAAAAKEAVNVAA